MRAVLLIILLAAAGFGQTTLNVSAQAVLLGSSESRAVKVSLSKGGASEYTVADQPAWLKISSTNNYTTPDTLYFQLGNSLCGDCTATVKLTPKSGGEAASILVRYSPLAAAPQTQLIVSPTAVNLSTTQARQVRVSAPGRGGVAYSVKSPPWLSVTSANHFNAPDTLYFQLVNANCGACTAEIMLQPGGNEKGTPVTVSYNPNGSSSYQAETRVTLAYPAPLGAACGPGFISGCNAGIRSTSAAVKTYSAKVNNSGDNWILINNAAGSVANLPVANGLFLSVNPAVADSLATGSYSGQVVVYNPANQADVLTINVSLLMNPGKIAISPAMGVGAAQTFTLQIPHPGGWQSLAVVNMLINNTLDGQHACHVAYEVLTEKLLLMDDEGKGYQSGANSQCGARLESAKGEDNVLTLAVNVTFAKGFAGKKNIYVASRDRSQNNSGWQILGTWEAPAPRPATAPPKKKKK